jgi:trypsin
VRRIALALSLPWIAVAGWACVGSPPVAGKSKVTSSLVAPVGNVLDRSLDPAGGPPLGFVRVTGGQAAAEDAWPFAVAFLRPVFGGWEYYCGGSLISRDGWILTAAHCPIKADSRVIVGRNDLRDPRGRMLAVRKVIRHPRYDTRTRVNDIALVRIAPPGSISPVVLGSAPTEGATVWAMGWGATSEGGLASLALLQVDVPTVGTETCRDAYRQVIDVTDSMLCAGAEHKDTCQGDSGGPLVVGVGSGARQVGIVSFGIGCGRKGFPGVYTNVGAFLDWIVAQTGIKLT